MEDARELLNKNRKRRFENIGSTTFDGRRAGRFNHFGNVNSKEQRTKPEPFCKSYEGSLSFDISTWKTLTSNSSATTNVNVDQSLKSTNEARVGGMAKSDLGRLQENAEKKPFHKHSGKFCGSRVAIATQAISVLNEVEEPRSVSPALSDVSHLSYVKSISNEERRKLTVLNANLARKSKDAYKYFKGGRNYDDSSSNSSECEDELGRRSPVKTTLNEAVDNEEYDAYKLINTFITGDGSGSISVIKRDGLENARAASPAFSDTDYSISLHRPATPLPSFPTVESDGYCSSDFESSSMNLLGGSPRNEPVSPLSSEPTSPLPDEPNSPLANEAILNNKPSMQSSPMHSTSALMSAADKIIEGTRDRYGNPSLYSLVNSTLPSSQPQTFQTLSSPAKKKIIGLNFEHDTNVISSLMQTQINSDSPPVFTNKQLSTNASQTSSVQQVLDKTIVTESSGMSAFCPQHSFDNAECSEVIECAISRHSNEPVTHLKRTSLITSTVVTASAQDSQNVSVVDNNSLELSPISSPLISVTYSPLSLSSHQSFSPENNLSLSTIQSENCNVSNSIISTHKLIPMSVQVNTNEKSSLSKDAKSVTSVNSSTVTSAKESKSSNENIESSKEVHRPKHRLLLLSPSSCIDNDSLCILLPKNHSKKIWDKTYTVSGLSIDSEEYKYVVKKFAVSQLKTSTILPYIYAVDRVDNPYTLARYTLKKVELEICGKSFKEHHLFHGTRLSRIKSILRNNFNWRLHGTHVGSKFGQGISFALASSYAVHYTDKNPNISVMLLVRVLVVDYMIGDKNTVFPPEGCDTTVSPTGKVWVKYNNDELYSDYLIYFKYVKPAEKIINNPVEHNRSRLNRRIQHMRNSNTEQNSMRHEQRNRTFSNNYDIGMRPPPSYGHNFPPQHRSDSLSFNVVNQYALQSHHMENNNYPQRSIEIERQRNILNESNFQQNCSQPSQRNINRWRRPHGLRNFRPQMQNRSHAPLFHNGRNFASANSTYQYNNPRFSHISNPRIPSLLHVTFHQNLHDNTFAEDVNPNIWL